MKCALDVAAARAGQPDLGYKLGSVELEMTAVQAKDAKGGLKLTIQTIAIKLVPEPLDPAVGSQPIDIPLADALVEVAEIVHKAKLPQTKFALGEASITLQFDLTKEGSVSQIGVDAAVRNAATHKLVVGLVSL